MLKKSVRNSNIEMLRIISMIFIIVSHYSVHNGINNYDLPIGFNRFLLTIFVLGNIGVILYVLISGYFLIDSDKFSLKKLMKIVLQVWFYSALIYLISCLCGLVNFSIRGFVANLLPIASKRYWFATAYVALYIFHPFLNKFLKSLTKKQWSLFLGTSLLLFSIFPSILTGTANFYGNELIQFVLFYSIGGYLKKYGLDFVTKKQNVVILIISILALLLSVIGADLISIKIPAISHYANIFYERHSIVAIVFCVSLFYCFINMKSTYNKFINIISSTTFGIYLLHENNNIRSFLWNSVFHTSKYVMSNLLLLHVIFAVVSVFVVGAFIDYTRQKLIETPLFRMLENKIDLLQDHIVRMLNK